MTIVVGYVPTPEGDAALRAAVDESRLRDQPLHVVNSSRGDALSDPRFASAGALDEVRARLTLTRCADARTTTTVRAAMLTTPARSARLRA